MPQNTQDPNQFLDPLGQFIAQAFMEGRIPGSQTSAYNTVLDLLSPGAVAGRAEAGVPDITEQFASMFGGMALHPQEVEQMLRQQAGVQLTPQQTSEQAIASNQALMDYLSKVADVPAKAETARAATTTAAARTKEAGSRSDWLEQLSKESASRVTEMKKTSPAEMAQVQQMNLTAMAMGRKGFDFTAGQMSAEQVDPQIQETAKSILGALQQNAPKFTLMARLLDADAPKVRKLGLELLQEEFPGKFDDVSLDTGLISWALSWLSDDEEEGEQRAKLGLRGGPQARSDALSTPGTEALAQTTQEFPAGGLVPTPEQLMQFETELNNAVATGMISPEDAKLALEQLRAGTLR